MTLPCALSQGLFTALAAAITLASSLWADRTRVEPPFWWADMPVTQLQLQLHGDDIGRYRATIEHPGIRIATQVAVDSPNYLFLYLDIDPVVEPGTFHILLQRPNAGITLPYELKSREPTEGRKQDFDPTRRQEGDIRGIRERLDYLEELGMTAIWFTPMFENNTPRDYGGYHGYAATDLYRVDCRLGSNFEYKQLVDEVHDRGMKVIMDMIHNHIGLDHWWMDDLPTADWVHDVQRYGYTNFRGTVPGDPNVSQYDKDRLLKGWFVPYMPDLNQRNELLAQDFLYSDANHNVIFLDTHDMARVYEALGKDEALFNIAYTLLLTIRGIPKVYYGTPAGMIHTSPGPTVTVSLGTLNTVRLGQRTAERPLRLASRSTLFSIMGSLR